MTESSVFADKPKAGEAKRPCNPHAQPETWPKRAHPKPKTTTSPEP
jgi:hypothetical protein